MGIYDRDYYQDELRPLRPWDNKSMVTLLIIVNVVLFVANFIFSPDTDALSRNLAVEPQNLWQPVYWWRLVTYGFTHDPGRINHILFNMVSLYFLGRSVEDRLGKWEFFRFYILTIVACGAVWCGLHAGSGNWLIGASGATTAVSMLFVFFYPQATLHLFGAIPVKAWVLGIMIIASNLFTPMGFSGESAGPQVAYDVHLVGAALAAAYFFGKWNFGFLGSFLGDMKTRAKQKSRGLKVHKPAAEPDGQPSKDELESDRILDKIYREGEDSLTSKERKFMERYSRQVRKRRQD